jgi:AcrR family transcriptional regulator
MARGDAAGSTASISSTRDRILAASGELMRRHGYAGTGIKAILQASGVPYGSLYHHFPGGKEEVGTATISEGGRVYLELVEAYITPDADLPTAIRALFDDAAEFVASTDYLDACPVATIAGEIASTSEPMRAAAAEAFTSWTDLLESRLMAADVGRARAHEVAVELFCLIEGAFLLARTTRDTTSLTITARTAEALVRAALSEVETARPIPRP